MTAAPLTIALNGAPHELALPCTLAQLLEQLGLDRRTVVVEHNRGIIRRDALDGVVIADGDAVEIVHFVGGG